MEYARCSPELQIVNLSIVFMGKLDAIAVSFDTKLLSPKIRFFRFRQLFETPGVTEIRSKTKSRWADSDEGRRRRAEPNYRFFLSFLFQAFSLTSRSTLTQASHHRNDARTFILLCSLEDDKNLEIEDIRYRSQVVSTCHVIRASCMNTLQVTCGVRCTY